MEVESYLLSAVFVCAMKMLQAQASSLCYDKPLIADALHYKHLSSINHIYTRSV